MLFEIYIVHVASDNSVNKELGQVLSIEIIQICHVINKI